MNTATLKYILRTIHLSAILTVLTLTAASCGEDVDSAQDTRQLVIDGFVDSDGTPEVLLTLSANPVQETNIKDHVVRWGKVTLSDGVDTVILTGRTNPNRVPPYTYYASGMRGVPGRCYTVTAEYAGRTAHAVCRMPYPTPIDEITFTPIETDSTAMRGQLTFTAPPDCPAYYRVYTRIEGVDSTYYPSKMGTVMAATPGQKLTIPIYRGTQVVAGNPDERLSFTRHAKVGVKLCRITPEAFAFYREFDNLITFGGGVFLTIHTPLPTNIRGSLGIWSAQGTSRCIVHATPSSF